jgi:hypothetical protein
MLARARNLLIPQNASALAGFVRWGFRRLPIAPPHISDKLISITIISERAVELPHDQIITGIIGIFFAVMSAVATYVALGFLKARKEAVKKLDVAQDKTNGKIDKLVEVLNTTKIDLIATQRDLAQKIGENDKVTAIAMATMMGKQEMLAQSVTHHQHAFAKLEGRLEDSIEQNNKFISSMSHMGKQIDALFTVVDAPRRASDTTKPSS